METDLKKPIIPYEDGDMIRDEVLELSLNSYIEDRSFLIKKYKIEIQNHPNPNGEGHIAAMGIRLFPDKNDENARFSEVRIFAFPLGTIGSPHVNNNVLKIYYDTHVVNNIVSILLAGKKIGLVYGNIKSGPTNIKGKPYADIHIVEDI